jgi:hypothetical protein
MVRLPARSEITLVWAVSTRVLPSLARHIRDADCVGGLPPAACVVLVHSEHEGGVEGGEGCVTARKFSTPAPLE